MAHDGFHIFTPTVYAINFIATSSLTKNINYLIF